MNKSKTLLSVLIVLLLGLFSVGCEVEGEIGVGDEMGEAEKNQSELSINLSIDDVLMDMPTEFTVEKDDAGYEGQELHIAFSDNELARIDFIGNEDDLIDATLMTSLNIIDNEEASLLNSEIVVNFVNNVIPEEDIFEWVLSVVEMYSTEEFVFEEKIVGDRKLQVYGGEDGILFFTVIHKDAD